MGTETTSTHNLLKILNGLSPRAKFINKEARRNRGHPDIFGCVCGRMVAIENKSEGYWKKRKGVALQSREIAKWKAAGAKTFIPKTDRERREIVEWVKKQLELHS